MNKLWQMLMAIRAVLAYSKLLFRENVLSLTSADQIIGYALGLFKKVVLIVAKRDRQLQEPFETSRASARVTLGSSSSVTTVASVSRG